MTTKLTRWLIIVCMLALAGPVLPRIQAQTGEVGTFEPTPCFFDVPGNAVEGEDIICGYVTVPERHAHPDGPTIRLAVAVIKSLSDDPAPDPFVIEAGGPGVPSLLSAPSMLDMAAYRASRDLVVVEQRGIPYSEPSLLCENGFDLITESYGQFPSIDEVRVREAEVLGACYQQWVAQGVDLSAYNSLENAADFPMVMDALGYDQFNFFGVSYSSVLGQHLMRDYPDRLRSVILDSVAPLSVNFVVDVPTTTAHAFRAFFDACATDSACNARFPDLETVFFDLVRAYNANPVTMPMESPFTRETVDAVITGEYLVMALYQQLYGAGANPALPASIYALAEGDTGFITDYVAPTRIGTFRIRSAMHNSVMCSEFVDYDESDLQYEDVPPEVVSTMLNYMDYRHICAVWPVDRLPETVHEPVVSDIPTLIMSGEFDPITPPSNGVIVAETLSNSYRVVFPGAGHATLGSSECALSVALDFLNDPTQAPDTGCIDDLGAKFIIPAPKIELEPYTDAEGGFSTLRPTGWAEVQPGIFLGSGADGDQTMLEIARLPDDIPLVDQIESWLPGLGIESFPTTSRPLETAAFTWDTYVIRATMPTFGTMRVAMAIAETNSGTYFVGLYAPPDDYRQLREEVFLPVVEAFALLE